MGKFLIAENISYKLKEQTIIEDITLEIMEGSHVTITGPSGGGKSTLLKLLASLLTPTKGKILFHDQNIDELMPEDYRKKVSYCFQQPSLFGETVKDNFLLPYTIRKKEFEKSHAVNLLKQLKLPEEYLDKKITELSGGEKQRVALIRNVLFLPEVLLLDEVTAGLDEESKGIVNQWLVGLNHEQNVTLIRVTHDSEEIAQSKEIRQIVAGRLES
ncbi:ABC transporter ATP-binding protein [Enterococcus rivorum]|uniref:Spermidine/putrescine ABC transporter ATP-binding protein n=1 Tax=Enterococcus rivorum TaxID=762845 RepID=A0A1E5KYW7_9ENTE|nr:ATP-binding cassette domain-containing protein [Enterococcus rivorum]MBP2097632.1 putative ABC transport system ATP-binding protein [Enterococcus rivorum]OEH83076.1 spermidine/putrescine ABC transporter ATP-binding protein [Enterococcus rivorum]